MRADVDLTPDDTERVWRCHKTLLMPRNARVDPKLHGFHCWRHRFEKDMGVEFVRSLHLREEALAWPGEWTACDAVWGHFAHQCLRLDVIAATQLNASLGNLDYEIEEAKPRWRELMTSWHPRFNPQQRFMPDGMTVLKRSAAAGQSDMLHLVAVESADPSIEEQVPIWRQPSPAPNRSRRRAKAATRNPAQR